MHRRTMFNLSAITALGLALLPSSIVAQQETLKQQLTGTWTLVSRIARRDRAPPASGAAKPRRPKPRMSQGLLDAIADAMRNAGASPQVMGAVFEAYVAWERAERPVGRQRKYEMRQMAISTRCPTSRRSGP